MPDKKTCFEALERVKINVSQGGDSESGFAAFCGPKDAVRYSDGSWK